MATDPIAPEEQEELEEQPVSKRYRFNPDTLRNLETQLGVSVRGLSYDPEAERQKRLEVIESQAQKERETLGRTFGLQQGGVTSGTSQNQFEVFAGDVLETKAQQEADIYAQQAEQNRANAETLSRILGTQQAQAETERQTDIAAGQFESGQEFQREERVGTQEYAREERKETQEYQTTERVAEQTEARSIFDEEQAQRNTEFLQTTNLTQQQLDDAREDMAAGRRLESEQLEAEILQFDESQAQEQEQFDATLAQRGEELSEEQRRFNAEHAQREEEFRVDSNLTQQQLDDARDNIDAGIDLQNRQLQVNINQFDEDQAEEVRQFNASLEDQKEERRGREGLEGRALDIEGRALDLEEKKQKADNLRAAGRVRDEETGELLETIEAEIARAEVDESVRQFNEELDRRETEFLAEVGLRKEELDDLRTDRAAGRTAEDEALDQRIAEFDASQTELGRQFDEELAEAVAERTDRNNIEANQLEEERQKRLEDFRQFDANTLIENARTEIARSESARDSARQQQEVLQQNFDQLVVKAELAGITPEEWGEQFGGVSTLQRELQNANETLQHAELNLQRDRDQQEQFRFMATLTGQVSGVEGEISLVELGLGLDDDDDQTVVDLQIQTFKNLAGAIGYTGDLDDDVAIEALLSDKENPLSVSQVLSLDAKRQYAEDSLALQEESRSNLLASLEEARLTGEYDDEETLEAEIERAKIDLARLSEVRAGIGQRAELTGLYGPDRSLTTEDLGISFDPSEFFDEEGELKSFNRFYELVDQAGPVFEALGITPSQEEILDFLRTGKMDIGAEVTFEKTAQVAEIAIRNREIAIEEADLGLREAEQDLAELIATGEEVLTGEDGEPILDENGETQTVETLEKKISDRELGLSQQRVDLENRLADQDAFEFATEQTGVFIGVEGSLTTDSLGIDTDRYVTDDGASFFDEDSELLEEEIRDRNEAIDRTIDVLAAGGVEADEDMALNFLRTGEIETPGKITMAGRDQMARVKIAHEEIDINRDLADLEEQIAEADATGMWDEVETLEREMQERKADLDLLTLTGEGDWTKDADGNIDYTQSETIENRRLEFEEGATEDRAAIERANTTGFYIDPDTGESIETIESRLRDEEIALEYFTLTGKEKRIVSLETLGIPGSAIGVDLDADPPTASYSFDNLGEEFEIFKPVFKGQREGEVSRRDQWEANDGSVTFEDFFEFADAIEVAIDNGRISDVWSDSDDMGEELLALYLDGEVTFKVEEHRLRKIEGDVISSFIDFFGYQPTSHQITQVLKGYPISEEIETVELKQLAADNAARRFDSQTNRIAITNDAIARMAELTGKIGGVGASFTADDFGVDLSALERTGGGALLESEKRDAKTVLGDIFEFTTGREATDGELEDLINGNEISLDDIPTLQMSAKAFEIADQMEARENERESLRIERDAIETSSTERLAELAIQQTRADNEEAEIENRDRLARLEIVGDSVARMAELTGTVGGGQPLHVDDFAIDISNLSGPIMDALEKVDPDEGIDLDAIITISDWHENPSDKITAEIIAETYEVAFGREITNQELYSLLLGEEIETDGTATLEARSLGQEVADRFEDRRIVDEQLAIDKAEQKSIDTDRTTRETRLDAERLADERLAEEELAIRRAQLESDTLLALGQLTGTIGGEDGNIAAEDFGIATVFSQDDLGTYYNQPNALDEEKRKDIENTQELIETFWYTAFGEDINDSDLQSLMLGNEIQVEGLGLPTVELQTLHSTISNNIAEGKREDRIIDQEDTVIQQEADRKDRLDRLDEEEAANRREELAIQRTETVNRANQAMAEITGFVGGDGTVTIDDLNLEFLIDENGEVSKNNEILVISALETALGRVASLPEIHNFIGGKAIKTDRIATLSGKQFADNFALTLRELDNQIQFNRDNNTLERELAVGLVDINTTNYEKTLANKRHTWETEDEFEQRKKVHDDNVRIEEDQIKLSKTQAKTQAKQAMADLTGVVVGGEAGPVSLEDLNLDFLMDDVEVKDIDGNTIRTIRGIEANADLIESAFISTFGRPPEPDELNSFTSGGFKLEGEMRTLDAKKVQNDFSIAARDITSRNTQQEKEFEENREQFDRTITNSIDEFAKELSLSRDLTDAQIGEIRSGIENDILQTAASISQEWANITGDTGIDGTIDGDSLGFSDSQIEAFTIRVDKLVPSDLRASFENGEVYGTEDLGYDKLPPPTDGQRGVSETTLRYRIQKNAKDKLGRALTDDELYDFLRDGSTFIGSETMKRGYLAMTRSSSVEDSEWVGIEENLLGGGSVPLEGMPTLDARQLASIIVTQGLDRDVELKKMADEFYVNRLSLKNSNDEAEQSLALDAERVANEYKIDTATLMQAHQQIQASLTGEFNATGSISLSDFPIDHDPASLRSLRYGTREDQKRYDREVANIKQAFEVVAGRPINTEGGELDDIISGRTVELKKLSTLEAKEWRQAVINTAKDFGLDEKNLDNAMQRFEVAQRFSEVEAYRNQFGEDVPLVMGEDGEYEYDQSFIDGQGTVSLESLGLWDEFNPHGNLFVKAYNGDDSGENRILPYIQFGYSKEFIVNRFGEVIEGAFLSKVGRKPTEEEISTLIGPVSNIGRSTGSPFDSEGNPKAPHFTDFEGGGITGLPRTTMNYNSWINQYHAYEKNERLRDSILLSMMNKKTTEGDMLPYATDVTNEEMFTIGGETIEQSSMSRGEIAQSLASMITGFSGGGSDSPGWMGLVGNVVKAGAHLAGTYYANRAGRETDTTTGTKTD